MAQHIRRLFILAVLALSPTAASTSAFALEAGDWLVRLRGVAVVPTGESAGIRPDLVSDSLEPQTTVVPEIDVTYMITDNIGVELIAATSKHEFEGRGPTLGGSGDVAEAWLLPPTLTLQWHFRPKSNIRPYVGAGINYTIAYAERADAALEALIGPTDVEANNSVGYAVQAGVDVDLNDRWFANFDVKYIDINVDIALKTATITRTADTDLNPVIVGFGIGYRF